MPWRSGRALGRWRARARVNHRASATTRPARERTRPRNEGESIAAIVAQPRREGSAGSRSAPDPSFAPMTRAVAIDLGPTRPVVAWADLDASAAPAVFPIPQLVAPAE